MYEEFISQRLAQLRAQKGVSARDMSLSIGQSSNYINTIENKKSLPSMSVFFYICEYLSITPKQFFDEKDTSPLTNSRLIQVIQGLREDDRITLLYLAERLGSTKHTGRTQT